MSTDPLWAARLHLSSGTPATLLDTEMIRAICEYAVAAAEREVAAAERCREEVLKEREAAEVRICELQKELDEYRYPPEVFPFRPFVPKHSADCKDQNCDRRCMVTKVTP